MPACHRPIQGLRLLIRIIVFCPGKLIGCPGYFPHDLGRIRASLFRISRGSKLMYLGARSFNSQFNLCTNCMTFSPSLAWPQYSCILGLRQSNWQFSMGQSVVMACVLYWALFSLIQCYFMLAQRQHCFFFQVRLATYAALFTHSIIYFNTLRQRAKKLDQNTNDTTLLATRDSRTYVLKAIVFT